MMGDESAASPLYVGNYGRMVVRFYIGTTKYTNDFVPASTNPDIISDTLSGLSGKTKLTKITDSAVSLDGTGDNLVCPDSSSWDFLEQVILQLSVCLF